MGFRFSAPKAPTGRRRPQLSFQSQFTAADGAVGKFKAAGSYSKDNVIGEFVKTVTSTNMDYSFAKACAAGVEAELSRTAAKN